MRTGDDEARAPKYSHVERERRWLVDFARLPSLPTSHVVIEDRYLDMTRFRLRRMTDSATNRVVMKLAKKYDAVEPTARPMVNAYLHAGEYAVFEALAGRMIAKRRYEIEGFSVDLFDGPLAGLVLTEREMPDAATLAALTPPAWALREVTQDARFQNGALASLDADSLAMLLA